VDDHHSGLASGTNDAFRQGDIALGVAVFGAIIPAGAAFGHGSAADYVTGMHHAAIVGAVLAAFGAVACSRLFRVGLASSGRRLAEAAVAVAGR
jgi:hypothetical protein